jgi:replicative DNA helicase
MEREEIVARLIARITHIPANKQQGSISQEEFNKIYATRSEISKWPLYVDDTPGLKIGQIRGRAIRQKRRYGLDLLVIDYLGLIKRNEKIQNTNYQIEEITQGLKNLAKELKVPVILLAQLNRELEKRDDKRPNMADLRDSGSIEQDSDVVMFLYRHEYYLTKSEPRQGERETDDKFNDRYAHWQSEVEKSRGRAELIISKHRQGECGAVPLKFMGWRCMFTDEGTENGDKI